jgi:competence protein ComEA
MFTFPHISGQQKRAIYFLLSIAIAIGGIFFSLSSGGTQSQAATSSGKLSGEIIAPTYSPAPTIPATIVVDVAGKVLRPGILTLPQGSRAADAIKAAGGALKGVSLTDINLAEVLTDGQQIIVGAPAAVSTSSKSKSGKGKAGKITSGTIDINTATLTQYEELPGVGAVMAGKILAYRTAHGPFALTTDLSKVSGMGKSKFAHLKSFIRV